MERQGYKKLGDVANDPAFRGLGLDTATLRRWCSRGLLAPDGATVKLHHVRLGKQRRTKIDDVIQFLEMVNAGA